MGKRYLFCWHSAATSSKIHTSVAIPQIIALFELEDSISRLQACQTKEDVLAMIEESKDSPLSRRIGFGKLERGIKK